MNSREKILTAIKANKPSLVPLSESLHPAAKKEAKDLMTDFVDVLKSIHTTVKKINSLAEIESEIDLLRQKNYFLLNAIKEIKNDRDDISFKKKLDLEALDFAFIKGEVAVSENGAIWMEDENFVNRLLPFICKHLCLVIDAKNIVSNMHEAYHFIEGNKTGFGVFISGPSKTADIEQSLVIGAHGALDLTVYIIENLSGESP
jgi:L-lactate dehydrogenase complex protein LldG